MAETNIRITVDTQQAQAAIDNLTKRLNSIDANASKASQGISTLSKTTQLAVGAFGALTASIGVRELVDFTARYTDLNSRLVNATGSQETASQAFRAISASARGTYSSLEETAKVFVRNSVAMNELGYTTDEQIKVTEALNNAIAVSGARGVDAASALDAFAQAVARGKMEGEDFNRLIENSPRIVKALADGLGVTTGEFRAMITEGKISSDVMIPALISQMKQLKTEADAMPATISDAFVVLQNSLFEFIGSTDQALGISEALAAALVFIADNTGILVGAIVGLSVAVGALLIPLIPAATAMAVLTGGAAVAGAIAMGAALGYAAQEAGLFAKNTEKAVDPIKAAEQAAKNAAAAEARRAAAVTRNNDLQRKAFRELDNYIAGLNRAANQERDRVTVGARQAEINKAIREQADKLAVVQKSLTAEQRRQITAGIRLKQTYEDIAATQQTFKTIGDQITLNSIADTRERDKQSRLLDYQASVSREIFEANRDNLTALIQQEQLTADLNQYKTAMRDIDLEIANIQIRDVREREIQNELAQLQLQLGREVFAITGRQLELKVRERAQQKLVNEEYSKAKNIVYGTFSTMALEIENTNKALGNTNKQFLNFYDLLMKTGLSSRLMAEEAKKRSLLESSAFIQQVGYLKEISRLRSDFEDEAFLAKVTEVEQIQALRNADIIDHEQYLQAMQANELRHMDLMQEATKKRHEYEARIRLMGMNYVQNGIALSNEEQKKIAADRANFEMKTDYQKTQFVLENGATIFNALGAQNKKAFEAAKALNIAVALMNTYRSATVALASYPFPFNLVAAAASVALGMAQVAAIRSQTYSGRALGGGVMGGGSYIVGERGPELFTPTNSGSITKNSDLASMGGTTNVNFTIVANDTRGFDELLTQRRGLITQIIGDAQLEKGRRL